MPLTESAKKFWFGNVEPQYRFDPSGPGGTILYEGYATPGVSEDLPAWVVVKHTFDGNNVDIEGQPKYGIVWTLRATYDFDVP